MASGQHDVDVGVVYTFERELMPPLLNSLAESTGDARARLILVDNASSGTAEWENQIPDTVVLRNGQRLGYAANLNRILEVSDARYLLLLNTDIYFDPAAQCVGRMVRFMDAHPGCGLGGCRIYHPDGSYAQPARRFQTPAVIGARRLGLSRLFRPLIERHFCGEQGRFGNVRCDWVSGCFMMLRKEALIQVGPFDGRFPKYFEDVDMCLRMATAGWDVLMNGQTWCFHHEQRASRSVLSRDAVLHLHSYGQWLGKWGTNPGRRISCSQRKLAPQDRFSLEIGEKPIRGD